MSRLPLFCTKRFSEKQWQSAREGGKWRFILYRGGVVASGFTVLDALRNYHRGIPIIGLSALTDLVVTICLCYVYGLFEWSAVEEHFRNETK
jgi:hypothetical protein